MPLIVLDTTPDYSLIEKAGYLKGISNNHGIHGVQDMCNLLRRRGIEYYLCAGHAMHSEVIAQVAGDITVGGIETNIEAFEYLNVGVQTHVEA